ncbi:hypothetical protein JHK82_049685 [Glycine max]|uniref:Uncharacterized protein n=2 Tax=Glycine subgen. Soja TaxID=1462606 RepID=K7MQM1_SOYBN|nr:hypothetical protein JHK86_049554 [Glycine max]KAG4923813.1 hypothetical protein JHK87_049353 [Glycine soja]KAG4935394.1 hypothetical protein JHK85_050313 [Glycine max]KAG5090907.1 hypothetical protein JHK82_049685 [Glycine max]KAG5093997.1 hypothetical protein JHK84_049585 [Glycine max]
MLTFFATSYSFPFTAQLLPYTSLSLIPLLPFPLVVCSQLKEDSCPSPRFSYRNGRFEVKRFHIGQVILRSSFIVTH